MTCQFLLFVSAMQHFSTDPGLHRGIFRCSWLVNAFAIPVPNNDHQSQALCMHRHIPLRRPVICPLLFPFPAHISSSFHPNFGWELRSLEICLKFSDRSSLLSCLADRAMEIAYVKWCFGTSDLPPPVSIEHSSTPHCHSIIRTHSLVLTDCGCWRGYCGAVPRKATHKALRGTAPQYRYQFLRVADRRWLGSATPDLLLVPASSPLLTF